METKILYIRNTHDPDLKRKVHLTKEQKAVWNSGINGFIGHMGSSITPMSLDDIHDKQLEYAEQFYEEPSTKEEVLQALTNLIESGLYRIVEV